MEPDGSLPCSQRPATGPYPAPIPRPCVHFVLTFYGEELLASHRPPRVEDHPLSAVCDSLFNIFAATLRIRKPSPLPAEYAPCHDDRDPYNLLFGEINSFWPRQQKQVE